jgi:hypothetical protein
MKLCVSGSEYSASKFMIYISLTSKEHDIHTSGPARKCKEHMRHICPAQPEKSALVEHIFQIGHNIYFGSIYILHKATGYMDHVTKEAIEIKLHPSNFNKDSGFIISQSWLSGDEHAEAVQRYTNPEARTS